MSDHNLILGDLILGIDTGGTFTDAVIMTADGELMAKAKALTSHGRLQNGIHGAIAAVLEKSKINPAHIAQVSLSTTLATNALVEGQGARAALVMIGFSPKDVEKAGLKEALGSDSIIYCDGGHNGHGTALPLDLKPLELFLDNSTNQAAGYAVAACFAVRNPAHEREAAAMITSKTHKPVTMSHELSPNLGGPKRGLTTLLNARLVPLVDGLLTALEEDLIEHGIKAPVLVVRGDGSLVSTAFARLRPIETILSGPAASVIGARHLTGSDNAIVSDIGGTTTDVAVLEAGLPRIDPQGARVGKHRTMVEAVAMRTFGLGGDSEVSFEESALDPILALGPRRAIPISLLAMTAPEIVHKMLDRQLAAYIPPRQSGRFAVPVLPLPDLSGLENNAAKVLNDLGDSPKPVAELAQSSPALAALDRLVRLGLVRIAALTPSDAAHVTGAQTLWDKDAARKAAMLFARRRTGRGQAFAPDEHVLSEHILKAVTRRTAEVILETAFAEDGLAGAKNVASEVVQRALSGQSGVAKATITLDRPIVGLGASAGLHYAKLNTHLDTKTLIPVDADVANAVGAATGMVRVSVDVMINAPAEDRFRVMGQDAPEDFTNLEQALEAARARATSQVTAMALTAGAETPDIRLTENMKTIPMEDRQLFVEATIRATATGRPRIVA